MTSAIAQCKLLPGFDPQLGGLDVYLQANKLNCSTFSKRKGGLFKKARDLSILCSVDIAVFIFNNKKVYEYSSSNPHDLVTRYQNVSLLICFVLRLVFMPDAVQYRDSHEHKDQYGYASRGEADADKDDDIMSSRALEKAETTNYRQRNHFTDIRHCTTTISLTSNDANSPARHGQNLSPQSHWTHTPFGMPDSSFNDDRSPQPQSRQPEPITFPLYSEASESKTVAYSAQTHPLIRSRRFTARSRSGCLPILASQFRTNGLTKRRLSGRSRRPKLTVQIPNGDSDQERNTNTGDSSSICRLTDTPLHTQRWEGSIVPAPQNPPCPALLFPGFTEPLNAVMRPPLNQQSTDNGIRNETETTQSLLPSRYLSNDFLISPNGFGLELDFRTNNSAVVPSPFNFYPFAVSSSLSLSPLI